MKSVLMKDHPNEWVLMHEQQPVVFGKSWEEVAKVAYEQYSGAPVFIGHLVSETEVFEMDYTEGKFDNIAPTIKVTVVNPANATDETQVDFKIDTGAQRSSITLELANVDLDFLPSHSFRNYT